MTIQERLPEPSNPIGMDGIEFIEYATSQPQAFGDLLQRMGFAPAARHRSREVMLYRQGPMNLIVNAHGAAESTPAVSAIWPAPHPDSSNAAAAAGAAPHTGTPVGLMGDAATFSFYPTKNLGACGEGGAVVSRRPAILQAARLMRVHGSSVRYRHDEVGYNYRMEGFQAAALNVKLRHLHDWTERRRAIARRYSSGIRLSDTALPPVLEIGESVYHQFTIRHPRRDALREHLTRGGVGTDLIYPAPLHLQPCYRELGYESGALPVAEEAARTVLSLPMFPELTDAEIDHVIATVNSF